MLGLSALLGLAIGALSPAQTDQLAVLTRGLFWMVQIGAGAALCLSIEKLWRHRLPGQLPSWRLTLGCGLVGSLVYTPFAWQMEVWFALSQPAESLLLAWLTEWRQVVVPFVGCWLLLRRSARHNPAKSSRSDSVQQAQTTVDKTGKNLPTYAQFWDQLPKQLGRDLLWVRAEEHYLRVATTRGKALIRCSLQRAILGALTEVQGLQVHRSYWLATSHVKRLIKGGQHWVCEMSDGARIPISRRRRAAVKVALAARAVYPQPEPLVQINRTNRST